MNHRKKKILFGIKVGHKKSILSNMSSSLIKNKHIFTTLSKAKALKRYIEPIITKSKINTTHSKRIIFSLLRDKYAVAELFTKSFEKVKQRYGGYTRIIKIGYRLGDISKIVLLELLDFNNIDQHNSSSRKKIRRSKNKQSNKLVEIIKNNINNNQKKEKL
ncbi:50S ribosomal protein L17 [Blattabacterium cuenoti]|nr:50S ribosomal protein L17 [Blattabacterium cuenoti]